MTIQKLRRRGAAFLMAYCQKRAEFRFVFEHIDENVRITAKKHEIDAYVWFLRLRRSSKSGKMLNMEVEL